MGDKRQAGPPDLVRPRASRVAYGVPGGVSEPGIWSCLTITTDCGNNTRNWMVVELRKIKIPVQYSRTNLLYAPIIRLLQHFLVAGDSTFALHQCLYNHSWVNPIGTCHAHNSLHIDN
ncbi:hypothetical protein GcC1_047033 [Golovinomyces cichoracearum]|uniref:Uncharacterized protein n=1 Tax=Golovinomyces cichoracearum TaxID=62708 RepID=A0A420IXS1_9PEZI|nr:hypothetical protein GcC1_047033 [Golovinomyces cichoracearum]